MEFPLYSRAGLVGHAIVDADDFEKAMKYRWYRSAGYVQAYMGLVNGQKKYVYLHQLIFGQCPVDRQCIDHIDRNTLNNQKANLRFVTFAQNNMNATKQSNTSSSFKGVCFTNRSGKWAAYIKSNGIKKHIGYFTSEGEAALAYNYHAHHLFGDYAVLNKVPYS